MKNLRIMPVVLVVLLGGCGGKKKQKSNRKTTTEMNTNVDIPVVQDDGIKSFFDNDVDAFTTAQGMDTMDNKPMQVAEKQKDDFSWVNEAPGKGFKKIYFDFDCYTIREDQRDNLAYNIDVAKAIIEQNESAGKATPLIIIDGHADSSAGSHVYNLVLSEKRAKVLATAFEAAGVPANDIKVVGHGSDIPAIVDGKAIVSGDREVQWANRRDELRLIYS